MGSHYANFRAITDDLRTHNAVYIVTKDNLATTLIELLRNQTAAAEMGVRARQVFVSQAGATGRCVDALREVLSPVISKERSS
jgi:3-deoxy-D-manno-octulosonic-acid transferase